MAKEKVKEFLQNFDGIKNDLPYISFSGGKDSCVLRHLVLQCQKELGMKSRCNLIVAQEIFHPQTYKFIQTIMGPNDKILP
jgi:predicted phosphoadenosine phosphosulfate sulfurtransferase